MQAAVAADDAVTGSLAVPKLGVGLAYQAQLQPFMEAKGDAFDFIEVVPEVIWNDLGPGRARRYVHEAGAHAFLDAQSQARQVVPHSIGLSIGSAHRFDREHLDQMARWHEWLRFPWHSDHLAFHQQGVDWQLWVERGDRPLPRKLVITTLDEPSQPQHEAVLTWDLSPAIDDSLFAFVPPTGAGRIVLAETDRAKRPTAKPK